MSLFATIAPKRVTNFALAIMLVLSTFAASVPFIFSQQASAVATSSYSATSFTDLTWIPDRTTPSGGYTVSNSELTLSVDNDAASSSTGFYRTEGVQAVIPSSNSIRAELYVDASWSGKPIRAGIWGIASSSTASDVAWPIIEYTTVGDGGFTGFRVFDTMNGGWTNLSAVSAPSGAWYELEITFNDNTDTYEYYVDGIHALTMPANYITDVYGDIKGIIFNNFNSATSAADNYSVMWRNLELGTPDTHKPTVAFVTPSADNQAFRGNLNVEFQADDDAGLSVVTVNIKDSANSVHLGTCGSDSGLAGAMSHTLYCTIDTTNFADGTYYLRAGATDVSGNNKTISRPVIFDNTRPTNTITYPIANSTQLENFIITGVATDVTSGVDHAHIWVTKYNTDGSFGGYLVNQDVPVDASGNYQLAVTLPHNEGPYGYRVHSAAYDKAGNSQNTQQRPVYVDNIRPTATFVFPAIGPTATSFEIHFNEAVNAVDAENEANYYLTNWPGAGGSGDLVGDAVVTYNGTTHVATVTFSNPGWYVSAEQLWGVENIYDLAGNVLNPTPTEGLSSPMINPSAPGVPAVTSALNSTSIDWTWTAAIDPTEASGVKSYHYVLTEGGTVITSGDTTATSVTTVVPTEGTYTLTVYATDNAGNDGAASTGDVTLDTINPSLTVNPGTVSGDVATITGTAEVGAVLSATFNGVTTAIANVNGTWSFTSGALENGTYAFSITATDGAGNGTIATTSVLVDVPVITITPAIVSPVTPGVLGATTDTTTDETTTNNEGESDVEGATDTLAAVDTDATDGSIFGLAWYWWLLILAALAAITSMIVAAVRRRNDEA